MMTDNIYLKLILTFVTVIFLISYSAYGRDDVNVIVNMSSVIILPCSVSGQYWVHLSYN